jgi:hypothetical protein
MPRYLRWIAAISSGIMAQFAMFTVIGAVALGSGNKELGQSVGVIATVGSIFVTLIPALAVNDWLAKRYPLPEKTQVSNASRAPANEAPLDDRI